MRRISLLITSLFFAVACGNSAPAPAGSASGPVAAAPSASAASVDVSALRGKLPAPVREGASLARSAASDALYVANEDLGELDVLPLPLTDAAPVAVKMPGAPAQVLALDGVVLVTIRDPGLLLAMKPDATAGLVELGRVALPPDAWGIAITPDEKTALVTSAWTHQVSGVDLGSMKKLWSVDVAREPRGIAIDAAGKVAYVTHLTRADLTRIDELASDTPKTHDVKFPESPTRTPAYPNDASLGYSLAFSPEGDRLYVARQALAAKGRDAWSGYGTLDTLLTADDTELAKGSTRLGAMWGREYQEVFSGDGTMFELNDPAVDGGGPTQHESAFTQPRAMSYRRTTRSILIASEGRDEVVELDALSIDPAEKPLRTYDVGAYKQDTMKSACGAPSGISLSSDETTAYVFCRSTHGVAALTLDPLTEVGHERATTTVHVVSLGSDPLDEKAALGRRLFYMAKDNTLSSGIACAGCHPDGRDDGHTWHVDDAGDPTDKNGFKPGGMHSVEMMDWREPLIGMARQTPMIAGRLSAPGPYGWKGESPNLKHRLIVGFTIHGRPAWYGNPQDAIDRADALLAFVPHLATPPVDTSPLTDQEERGKKVFNEPSVGCTRCHVPETEFTNRGLYDLGKTPTPKGRYAEEDNWKFKTPSLKFVGGTAPYLHDGGVPTLEALIEQNGDRMGTTSKLSHDDKAALVAYLKRL